MPSRTLLPLTRPQRRQRFLSLCADLTSRGPNLIKCCVLIFFFFKTRSHFLKLQYEKCWFGGILHFYFFCFTSGTRMCCHTDARMIQWWCHRGRWHIGIMQLTLFFFKWVGINLKVTLVVLLSGCLKALLSAGVHWAEPEAAPPWGPGPSTHGGTKVYLISGSVFRSANLGSGRSKDKQTK